MVAGTLLFVGFVTAVPSFVAHARYIPPTKKEKGITDLSRVLVLDGKNIHNVGELQMNVLNWGEWGSRPGAAEPFSSAPSAQWPAGTGVEYLYSAGLWIGAVKNGIPSVSTATFEREFRPSQDPRDIIYETAEGAQGGNRRPSPDADDDGDGLIDEDWLDGYDNDGDGRVDEDFAAISRKMLTCRYTDDQPISREINSEHNPLNILVRQESYQWDGDRFDDFVGVQYFITNIGNETLEDVYIGMFADADAGPRDRENYWEDDLTGRIFVPVVCTDVGPTQVEIAYTYDADGDDGRTPGRFGVVILGHATDLDGQAAPKEVGIKSYAHFAGHQSFEMGGDPINDFERYELLSQEIIEQDAEVPRDYRMLVSTGPFRELLPGGVLVLQLAFVVGPGLEGGIDNAAHAQIGFHGVGFNRDGDPATGIDGKETPIFGPAFTVFEDTCFCMPFGEEGDTVCDGVPFLADEEVLWTNDDCAKEWRFMNACGFEREDRSSWEIWRTGVNGKESRLNWIVGMAPPPPNMRIDDHARDGVVIYWDNFSETARDPKTLKLDFEGYHLWRADDWTRPSGTSVETGPPTELWRALLQADIVNGLGENTGLAQFHYEPLGHLSSSRKRDLIDSVKNALLIFPEEEPNCPPGITAQVCDTLKALARWEMGIDGGRQYYGYLDKSIQLGRPYFYSAVAFDNGVDNPFGRNLVGDPASNFRFVEPKSASQLPDAYDENLIYVVPNPATKQSMAAWALDPTNEDPTGIKVEFRNLPPSRGVIRIYTLSGDLVRELHFDATTGVGSVKWDLVSRSGQDITSGVYLYSIQFQDSRFHRVVEKFTVIR